MSGETEKGTFVLVAANLVNSVSWFVGELGFDMAELENKTILILKHARAVNTFGSFVNRKGLIESHGGARFAKEGPQKSFTKPPKFSEEFPIIPIREWLVILPCSEVAEKTIREWNQSESGTP